MTMPAALETFYAVTDGATRYVCATHDEAVTSLRQDQDAAEFDTAVKLTLIEVQMTRAEFEALPDFEGF
jgi:hypothetical protein